MKEKAIQYVKQFFIYFPLAGIISTSMLSKTVFQNQLSMLLLLVWAGAFFLYQSWLPQ